METASEGGGFVGIYGLPPSLRSAIAAAISAASGSAARRLASENIQFHFFGEDEDESLGDA